MKKMVVDNGSIVQEPLNLRILGFAAYKINDIIPLPSERYFTEQVFFDYFSKHHINNPADLVFHTDSGLNQTLNQAKKIKIPSIILHRTLSPQHTKEILSEECAKFRVNEKSAFTHKKWNQNRTQSLKECDHIFALSRLEFESLCKYGISRSKVTLIDHGQGVDAHYFKPMTRKIRKPFTILFVGNKSLIKGVPYLLEAWKALNLKDARLIVAGSQDNTLLKRYMCARQFEVTGTVEPLKYYNAADILVVPSLGESFSRVMLEAMSCALPVIISDMVGAKDIITNEKEGFIIPAKNSERLAEKIKFFYDNPNAICRMGQNARETAEQFTWEKFGKEVTDKAIDIIRK